MLTPEQQADYDFAMSLLEKNKVVKISFAINADGKLFEKTVKAAAEKMNAFTPQAAYADKFNFKIHNKMMKAFGIPNSIFQGATSAQDSK